MTGTERQRDGFLAVAALAALVGLLRERGSLAALRDPVAMAGGVGSALLVEVAFLRYPERLRSLWARPSVAVGSAAGLTAAGWAARRSRRLLAAGVWGLLTYLGLLAVVLTGRENPATVASGDP